MSKFCTLQAQSRFMFANRYIEKNINYPRFINETPELNLGIIIVIPCYREPNILETINSLYACDLPDCALEIIVVINQSEKDREDVVEINSEAYNSLTDWKTRNNSRHFKVFPIYPDSFNSKFAGAGLARKTGMDEAVRRFDDLNNEKGIIVSLDADTLVERNYLVEIEKHFSSGNNIASTIKFKHRIKDENFSERLSKGINLYERYLHYYKNALAFTGYPFALYTIGSAFCVKAKPYVLQGGMNKKKAGEDFYFLHKLSQLGNIGEINTTCVYPEARISDRVPFGTGPVLQKWLNGDEDLNLTYNFSAFIDLKLFFDQISNLYEIDLDSYNQLLQVLPASIHSFLIEDDFFSSLFEINKNSSEYQSFKKRFFQNFNAFKILKFINYAHSKYYKNEIIEMGEHLLILSLKL